MSVDAAIRAAFAPKGALRAVINYGNPILAHRGGKGEPAGVSVDLARELARELGVACDLTPVEAAAAAVETVTGGGADVGFFAIDPLRGAGIAFTRPYILIEGNFLVRASSSYLCNEDVDQRGVIVAVGKGSAYDLFLTRNLKQATLSRDSTSPEVVDAFMRNGFDVAAGVRQQLEHDMRSYEDLRIIEPNFMVIRQAMGLARDRGEAAALWLDGFVARMKATGFVAEAMRRHGIDGAAVAD